MSFTIHPIKTHQISSFIFSATCLAPAEDGYVRLWDTDVWRATKRLVALGASLFFGTWQGGLYSDQSGVSEHGDLMAIYSDQYGNVL